MVVPILQNKPVCLLKKPLACQKSLKLLQPGLRIVTEIRLLQEIIQ